ncbi:MAG: tRNA lysidine(34) synthetase TilS [Christensenellales bacterium]
MDKTVLILVAKAAMEPLHISGAKVLVAVSGGADSMALLDVLCALADEMDITLAVGHVNHGLRGEAAERDEAFVQARAEERGLDFFVRHVRVPQNKRQGESVEEAARRLRYDALGRMRDEARAQVTALAHHADDQAETVLMRLIRGASLHGLGAMRVMTQDERGTLIRPLLEAKRSDIEAYCRANRIAFAQDETNDSDEFLRNKIRRHLIPILKERYNPAIVDTLFRSAGLWAQESDFIHGMARGAYEAHTLESEEGRLLKRELFDCHPAILRQVIVLVLMNLNLPFDSETVERIAGLHGSQSGRKVPVGEGTAYKSPGGVMVLAYLPPEMTNAVPVAAPGRTATPLGVLTASQVICGNPATGPFTQLVPVGILKGAVIRPWRAGDRMRPMGLRGAKLVSDILTDARVPAWQKGQVLVLESGGKILWLVGFCADEAIKVKSGERCMKLEFISTKIHHVNKDC